MLKFKKSEFKITQYLEATIKGISMSENLMGNAENMIGNLIYTVPLSFSFFLFPKYYLSNLFFNQKS